MFDGFTNKQNKRESGSNNVGVVESFNPTTYNSNNTNRGGQGNYAPEQDFQGGGYPGQRRNYDRQNNNYERGYREPRDGYNSYRGYRGRGDGGYRGRGRGGFGNRYQNNNFGGGVDFISNALNNDNSFYKPQTFDEKKEHQVVFRSAFDTGRKIQEIVFQPERCIEVNQPIIKPPAINLNPIMQQPKIEVTGQNIQTTLKKLDSDVGLLKLAVGDEIKDVFNNLHDEQFAKSLVSILKSQPKFLIQECDNSNLNLTVFDILNYLKLYDLCQDADQPYESSILKFDILQSNEKYVSKEIKEIISNYRTSGNNSSRRELERNEEGYYNYYPIHCSKLPNCPNGNNCTYAHSQDEVSFHPVYYKAFKCYNHSHYEKLGLNNKTKKPISNLLEKQSKGTLKDQFSHGVNIYFCPHYHTIKDFMFNFSMSNVSLTRIMSAIKADLAKYFIADYYDEIEHFYHSNLQLMTDHNDFNSLDIKDMIKNGFNGFDLDTFKITKCPKMETCKFKNNQSLCLFAHFEQSTKKNQTELRRPIQLYQYSHIMCCKLSSCNNIYCPYSHSKYEYYYHYRNFRKIRLCMKEKPTMCAGIELCVSYFTCYGIHLRKEEGQTKDLTCSKCNKETGKRIFTAGCDCNIVICEDCGENSGLKDETVVNCWNCKKKFKVKLSDIQLKY